MRVCVVGSGGREHAFATVLSQSSEVVVTPGSPGIKGSTAQVATEIEADLYVVGPEVPLVQGLADQLRADGRAVFGPGSDGARLEGSKAWMKSLVEAAGVPTARYASFGEHEADAAVAFLSTLAPPYVVKTDGLAAGKGVLVTDTYTDAVEDVRAKLSGTSFGDSGRCVVIEEGLSGPELSLFAFCDGEKAALIPTSAQDHKRLRDQDLGPNTGGMGCYSPMPTVSTTDLDDMMNTAVHPTVEELRKREIDYRGVLFAGFMMTEDGPKLLEFNVRFGDPEAQVILPRFEGDLAETLLQVAIGDLQSPPTLSTDAMVTVVLASQGYPTAPQTGDVIYGLEEARAIEGVEIFCAGVALNPQGELVTGGGRVLNVCGRAAKLETARDLAYNAVSVISWSGMQHRTDIGASIQADLDKEEVA
ncbi:MAG: phosphoribosylamine--glycine ligase [Actinomycetota bacterium]|nr:phosphoribosylamine--glycine ligase [Acidimicrobiales bacterium]MEE2680404.1 phosphoribosylamine--glycine ligase [Actinomycetota bacterium]MEE3186593.1 phosphoribosylamine--glycine ligase [Actinomycetota bacterium]